MSDELNELPASSQRQKQAYRAENEECGSDAIGYLFANDGVFDRLCNLRGREQLHCDG